MTKRSLLTALLSFGLAVPVGADVAFDAFSSASNNSGSHSFTHSPGGTPRALLFCAMTFTSSVFSALTYGSTDMISNDVALSPREDGGGEDAKIWCWFLGSGIPTGDQTVAATWSGGSTVLLAVVTLTAGGDTEVTDTSTIANISSNPSVTLSLGGNTSFASIGFGSGQNTVSKVTPFTSWTDRVEVDTGSQIRAFYTYDTIGSSDVSCGWTQASDDATAICVAITESAAPGGNPSQLLLMGVG